MYDGSDYYGAVISSPVLQQSVLASIQELASSISNTNGDWYGNSISTPALAQLEYLLNYAKQHTIKVIGFLPPIAPSEYVRIQSYPAASYARTISTLGPTLSHEFTTYGFDFYDFSNIAKIGGSDTEMMDSKHGGEKMYLQMFIEIAKTSKSLQPFVDLPHIEQKLSEATSSYVVFGLTQ